MVNDEIVWGIKNALDRGESLQNAMMSFFNAGYDKKEIEDAARTLLNYQSSFLQKKNEIAKANPKEETTQKFSQLSKEEIPPLPQTPAPLFNKTVKESVEQLEKVQKTETPAKKDKSKKISNKEKTIVTLLIIFLAFLFGILIIIFLFRQQLVDFIGNMMG